MKHQVANTIKALVMMAGLMSSFESMAAKPCPNELLLNDNVLDLRAIYPKQDALYEELDQTKTNKKNDLRRKIDRHTIEQNDPMYALNLVGKVTITSVKEGQPDFDKTVKLEENNSWGSGTMISPCHMLTNHHVICERETVDGINDCKRDGSVNKHANFSFGENDTGTDYSHRVTGDVIWSNNGLNSDYAIVKIKSKTMARVLKEENLKFPRPNFWSIEGIENVPSLSVGYPFQHSIGANSHKLFGMKAMMKSYGPFLDGKVSLTPGNSGSPILNIVNNELVMSGLVINSYISSKGDDKGDRKILSLPALGLDLKEKNPSLLKEILAAGKNNSCE